MIKHLEHNRNTFCKNEIWIAGYPSFYGGADTELDHNIDVWRTKNVAVHLVPMFGMDPQMRVYCNNRGCRTHTYRPGIFKDKIVASFCNGQFLERLPEIMAGGKPETVIWFNTMTWTFPAELTAHKNKWIDLFGFGSDCQRRTLKPELEKVNPVTELVGYRQPYNLENRAQKLVFQYREPKEWFGLGRLSRDDAAKYSTDMWKIFDKVCTPIPKKVFVMGYGPNAGRKTGSAPDGLDWQTWLPNAISVAEFYGRLHCVIHKTGGSRESYCRIVPEAYAAGVPVVVEDDFAFPELVVDGVTGFRCKTSDEMSFRASQLAFDEELRKKIIHSAHEFLVNELASPEKCWQAWRALFQ